MQAGLPTLTRSARRHQAAVARDPVADDRPSILVGDVEEALGRIEGEETRRAAQGRHPLARRERALGRIDGEHADTVVAAVGDVEVAAGAIDRDLGAGAVAGELGRRRRDGLQRRQGAGSPVLAVGGEGRVEFIGDVSQRLLRMEIDVTRRGAGTGRHARGFDQHAALGVEAIGDDDVGALARHVEEAALAIERDVMHAHGALLDAVRPQCPRYGGESPVGHQAAVGGDRQHGERIGAVVADREEAARRVEGEMHRIVAAGRLPVERRDMARALVDGEGVGFGAIAVHRIEMRARAVEGEERRVLQPTEMLDVREGAGAAVDAIDVDAVALAVTLGRRVAADIGEEGAVAASGAFHLPPIVPRCAAAHLTV